MRIIRFCRSLQISAFILFFLLTFSFLSGSSQNGGVFAQTPPARTISSLGPATVSVGDPSFTLEVNGTNFVNGDTVTLAGTKLATTFVSDTLLTAFVPASALQLSSFLQVQILPQEGGQPQGSVQLFVVAPSTTIAIAAITPSNVTVNQDNISLAITETGSGKLGTPGTSATGLQVLIAGNALTPTVTAASGANTLTVTVSKSITAVEGFLPVQIRDLSQTVGNQLSNMQTLNVGVTNTTPVITSITPSTVSAGIDDFIMTIVGHDFVPGAQVTVGATTVGIISFSDTLLRVVVPTNAIRTAGNLPVIVTNPGNVASTDGTQLVVTAPVYLIQSISPQEVIQGGPTVEVEIFGDNIPTDNSIQITLNGAALPTGVTVKSTTADVINIEILNTAAVLATPGTLTFTVTNPADTNPPVNLTIKVDPANLTVSTFAGDPAGRFLGLVDGPLAQARFSKPSRMAESPVDHSLWIADKQNNAVRRIAMDPADPNFGKVVTIAGSLDPTVKTPGPNFTRRGINCLPGSTSSQPSNGTAVPCVSSITVTPDELNPSTNPIIMNFPVGVIVDANNVVYVSEGGSSVIRRITPQGPIDNRSYVVDILAGAVTDTTDSTTNITTRTANPGSADTAPNVVAQFHGPDGLALGKDVDGNDVLYVADSQNFKIRRVFLDGPKANTVDTLVGQFGNSDGDRLTAAFGQIAGLELEADGISLLVADPNNREIRLVNSLTGDTTTVGFAGNLNTDGGRSLGGFAAPTGTAITQDGKILVADSNTSTVTGTATNNNAIRWLQNDGGIVTVAGMNSATGGFADGAQFTAQFNGARGLLVASDGTIYVVDTNNNLIRKITAQVVKVPPAFNRPRPIARPEKTGSPARKGN